MRVTRDVIYDLLPAYFSGEVSADTKALIDDFFASDPEFGRMAERFRQLHQDGAPDAADESDADRERHAFEQFRNRVRRQKFALMWAVGAAVAFLMAMLTPFDGRVGLSHPGMIIGIIFAWVAAAVWFSAAPRFKRRNRHPEKLS